MCPSPVVCPAHLFVVQRWSSHPPPLRRTACVHLLRQMHKYIFISMYVCTSSHIFGLCTCNLGKQSQLHTSAMVLTITSVLYHNSCELLQVHRLPDFSPCLLQIIMNDGVPFPSRQAGKTCSARLSTNTVYVCMYVYMYICMYGGWSYSICWWGYS